MGLFSKPKPPPPASPLNPKVEAWIDRHDHDCDELCKVTDPRPTGRR